MSQSNSQRQAFETAAVVRALAKELRNKQHQPAPIPAWGSYRPEQG